MEKSEKLADLVLAIPIQAKANPRWIGWDELEKLANEIKNFNVNPDYELIVPERIGLGENLLSFRLAVLTRTIEQRYDAIEMLHSYREGEEVIVVLHSYMHFQWVSSDCLVAIATPIQIVDFLAADYIEVPK